MKLFIYLFLSFIVVFVLLVISHEGGHYIAARAMGYSHAHIHYNHTDTGRNPAIAEYKYLLKRNRRAIEQNAPFADEERLLQLNAEVHRMADTLKANNYDMGKGSRAIYAAGPFTNLLTATIGIILLLVYRDSFKRAERLAPRQWLVIFTALIWFKPVYELTGAWSLLLISGPPARITDEYKLCANLGLYPWTINMIEAIAGIFFVWFTLKFVPAAQRRPLVAALLSGGLTGYALWHWVGLVILP